jgi:hypothetical protein
MNRSPVNRSGAPLWLLCRHSPAGALAELSPARRHPIGPANAADTKRLAVDSQTLAANSQKQLTFSERPFVAMVSSYDEEMSACLVYAHNQGVGPALDLEVDVSFDDGELKLYSVGCLPADGKFQFLMGTRSLHLQRTTNRMDVMPRVRLSVKKWGMHCIHANKFDRKSEGPQWRNLQFEIKGRANPSPMFFCKP